MARRKPVGLGRREARGDDGDVHRLLLEQRHAQGLAQHLAQRRGRIFDRLLPGAAAQIGMHHVALDGARADDRDFDDEIVEAPRLEARQHAHLRPAFDLEHADGIRVAQHVVNRGDLGRHGGHRQVPAVMAFDEIEGAADAAQHAERQHVDLEHSERVEIVLVPFDDGAIRHRRILDRHHLFQKPARDDEAADMLRQMPRKARPARRRDRAPGAASDRPGRGPARARAFPRARRRPSPRPFRRARRSRRPKVPAPCRPRGWHSAGDSRSPWRSARRGRGRICR